MTTVAIPVIPAVEAVAAAPLDLAHLVRQTAQGDRLAFAELYENLAPRVFGLVLRVIANRALAEETTQDVFLEVWQKAAAFDAVRGGVVTWVMTIAHHRAVDRVRAHQNAAERDQRVGLRNLDADGDWVALQVEERASARATRDALATLTASQRRVISMAYFEGYSQTQIAALTGTPLGTIKSATRAALTRLRAALAPSS